LTALHSAGSTDVGAATLTPLRSRAALNASAATGAAPLTALRARATLHACTALRAAFRALCKREI
jgi:hypothetical protein